jgi:predicted transcriptional regulator
MTEDQLKTYRVALKQARASFDQNSKRLAEISIEEHRLVKESANLRRTITALAAMCSENPAIDSFGITESCMEAMDTEIFEVTTQDVVKSLEEMGFDIASQKNAAASVHSVLSRLAEKGKIQKITDDEGRSVSWRGPHYDPPQINDEDIPF